MSAPERVVLRNITRGTALATDVRFALKHRERRRGLLGRESMAPDEALVFPHCRQVHMVGMKFPIDALFLDKHGTAVRCVGDLQPGKVSPWVRRARTTVELPPGTLARTGTVAGDRVVVD